MTEFLLLAVGIWSGLVNAIAGGGTFFSFPVFLALGLPPVVANATNAAAVLPSHPMAAWAERRYLRSHPFFWPLLLLGMLGGAVGAYALINVGNDGFERLIPYLLLIATLLFAFGTRLRDWLRQTGDFRLGVGSVILLLLICAYGGFFAAGMGVMLMAGLLLLGMHQMAENNAVKNLLGGVVNLVAVLVWGWQGLIEWSMLPWCFVGAVLGGVLGAKVARVLSVVWLRRVVITVGLGLSGVYFF
ncbi:MAG: sulfite exporter TauE/SafE family protein [Pseudomonadota bacterium]|nr:sulfite exporter TauE/SafE family protein [Pseudomonadota bacterium]